MLRDSEEELIEARFIHKFLSLRLSSDYCYHRRNEEVGRAQIQPISSNRQVSRSEVRYP